MGGQTIVVFLIVISITALICICLKAGEKPFKYCPNHARKSLIMEFKIFECAFEMIFG